MEEDSFAVAVAVAVVADGPGTGAGGAPIYAPPVWVPPAQEFPAYYSAVAAAPGAVEDYAAPNEGGDVYRAGGGASAAMYASSTESGAVYAEENAGNAAAYAPITNAAAYAPITNAGVMYGGDDGTAYSNDAYGNYNDLADSSTNA
jgi:hypothetical protein